MRNLRLVSRLLAFGLVGAALAQGATQKKIVQQTVSWKGPGGSYCGFAKFPKGFSEPKHFHTNDLHVIVLEGQWGVWAPGAPEQYVTAGGYQFIPGGTEHVSKCGPTTDCVVYDCGPAAFDIQGLAPLKQ
jgi:uncharacterized protein DUF4437